MVVESNSIVTNPTISVCILCYNHQAFIEKCLDNVLAQKTAFTYEIVLGDDCSTDKSAEICLEYQRRYPDKIRLFLNETNQGLIRNYVYLLSQCRGTYIAVCAGDDYWCDEKKLQKQVVFLSEHSDYSMCFTNAFIESHFPGENSNHKLFGGVEDREYQGDEIIIKWTVPASSVVFRNNLFDPSVLLNRQYFAEDLITYLLLKQYGKLFGMSDVMTVYVLHGNSINGKKRSTAEFLFRYKTTLESIDKELERKYHSVITKDLSIAFYMAAKDEFKRGSKRDSFRFLFKAVINNPFSVCSQLWKSLFS